MASMDVDLADVTRPGIENEPGETTLLESPVLASESAIVVQYPHMYEYVAAYKQKFADVPNHLFVYRMDFQFRGYAIIINNQKFDDENLLPYREASHRDRDALKQVCLKLGFAEGDIITRNNQTVDEMKQLLKDHSSDVPNDPACIMVFILTHGGTEGKIYGRDSAVKLVDLIRPLKNSKSLTGKPKIIFTQACRGNDSDPGKYVISDESYGADGTNMKKYKISLESDFFYAYSTVEGHSSWRNKDEGSWFIQALHDVVTGSQGLEINALMVRVARMVSYQFESRTNDDRTNGKKQSPFYASTLTKDLYFN